MEVLADLVLGLGSASSHDLFGFRYRVRLIVQSP